MKRIFILLIGIALISAAAAFGLTYDKQSNAVAATGDVVQVDLLGDHANPSVVSVQKGKYVQFNTKDGKTHDIGQGRGESEVQNHHDVTPHEHITAAKVSGQFGEGEAYKLQFTNTGTFTFHDHLNPKISIVVVVYESEK